MIIAYLKVQYVSVSFHRRQLPQIKTESVHGVCICECVCSVLYNLKKYIDV